MGRENFIYFRPDLTEYITQDFVDRFSVNTDAWLFPDGYFLQNEGTVGSDKGLPDGAYIMIGHVEYTTSDGLKKHKIGQFVGVKLAGINFVGTHELDYYPNSKGVILDPMFALVRVGETWEFKKVGVLTEDFRRRPITEKELDKHILRYDPNTIESKIYRLRLALQRQMV